MTIKEYRDLKLPSYSLLSKLSQHPKLAKAMIDGEQIKSKFMDLGSLIDMLLTAPDEVVDNYYLVSGNLPTNSYMQLVTEYIRLLELSQSEAGFLQSYFDQNSTILQARSNIQFQSNWKDETVVTNFHKECDHYLSEYLEAGDKIMITQGEFANAKSMANSVLENEFTKKYFTKPEEMDIYYWANIEIHYQYPIICTIEGQTVKTLLDIFYVDHNKKEIEVLDIKTFSESFLKSYLKYRYYIQGAVYNRSVFAGLTNIIVLTDKYFGYKIKPFKFLTIDTSGFESPTLYEMSSIDMKAATTGGLIGSYTVKGYIKLLEEYKWHMENDKWEYPKEVYDTGVKLIAF
jgi:mRNA-degrading endonuclease HigB of HigAB toxin-antitoxin module